MRQLLENEDALHSHDGWICSVVHPPQQQRLEWRDDFELLAEYAAHAAANAVVAAAALEYGVAARIGNTALGAMDTSGLCERTVAVPHEVGLIASSHLQRTDPDAAYTVVVQANAPETDWVDDAQGSPDSICPRDHSIIQGLSTIRRS